MHGDNTKKKSVVHETADIFKVTQGHIYWCSWIRHRYNFLLLFTCLLYEIKDFEIWMMLKLTYRGHSRSNVTVPLDFPYTEYVLIEAHALIDAHHPSAKNKSHQIHSKCLIKHQKIVQKHWIWTVFQSVWLLHIRKSPLLCKQRSTRFLFTVYMRIVGTGRQALLLKLIDAHRSPCTRALHFY